MKRYFMTDTDTDQYYQIVVGTDREIRSLYRQLYARDLDFTPSHCGFPAFRGGSMYGVEISESGEFSVLNSDTLCRLMLA